MTHPSRRSFLTGMLVLAAAPAIIRASSLMPVKRLEQFQFSQDFIYTVRHGLPTWRDLSDGIFLQAPHSSVVRITALSKEQADKQLNAYMNLSARPWQGHPGVPRAKPQTTRQSC